MIRANKWLLMVVMTAVTIANLGIVFAIGTLFLEMMDSFQTDRATTATVQSLLIGVTFGFGVVSGILISKLGFSKSTFLSGVLVTSGFCVSFFTTNIYFVYVSIGTISATGISIAFIACMTLASEQFTGTSRLVCVTVLNTAIAVGAMIYPFFLDWIQGIYGLFGTFLIIGGITCNTFVLFVICFVNDAAIHIPTANSNDVLTDITQDDARTISEKRSKFQYIKDLFTLPFICLLLANGVSISAINGFIGLMLDIAVWKGFSDSQGLNVIIIFNAFSLISRIVPVILNHKTGISDFACAIAAASSGGVGQILVCTASGYVPYVLGHCLCGIALGGILSSSLMIVVNIVRLDQKPVAYGLLYTVIGLLSTITGAALGKVRDIYGSYTGVVLSIGGIHFAAAALYYTAYKFRKNK